jgi:hypothetical protein
MDLKPLAVLFVVLLSIIPAYAAGNTSLNVQDVGANVIQAGFDLVIRGLADGLRMLWADNGTLKAFDNNTNVTQKYGETRSSIFTFITVNVEPDKIKAVQDIEDKTTPIWLLLVVFYILGNPIRNILARAGYQTYSSNFGSPNLSSEKYVGTVILLIMSYATPNLFLVFLQACTIVSQYFMLNIMDYIEPSLGNAWLYLFMMLGEAFLAVFFIVRPFVICIMYAVCKLLVVWFLIGVWRGEITWVWSRFLKIMTLQPIVIFITCICIVGIKWAGLDQSPGAYIAMFFLLFYICYKWMTGNFDLPGKITRLAVRSAL